ncbi:MAG TPA: MFS transporter [Acidimicrobiales bacterium]|nr:MFS transporter [Acidimicrobiales bacterium]
MRASPSSSSGPRADRGPGRRPPRALLFTITITGILANTLVAPAIPDILADLGAPASGAGLVLAAATLPGVIVAPVIGLLADRYGRRLVLVPCLVTFGLAGGLSGLAPSFSALIALRLLQGVGSAGLINLAVVVIADHWHGVDRARVIGQNSAVLTISLALAPPVGGVLTDAAGWRAAFAPFWLGLVTAAVAARLLGPSPRQDVRVGQQVLEALRHLRPPRVLAAMGSGMVLFFLIFGLMLTTLPLYLAEDFALGASQRGLVLGAPALTATAGALALGRLTERFGSRRLVVVGTAVVAIAFATVAQAPVLGVIVFGVLLYGVGEGAAIPSLQAMVAGAAPPSSRGSVIAVWVGGVRAGQSAGPLVAGAALGWVGAPGTFLAGAALAGLLLAAQLASGQPTSSPDEGASVAAAR